MTAYMVNIKFKAETDELATKLAEHLSKEALTFQVDGTIAESQIAVVKLEEVPPVASE